MSKKIYSLLVFLFLFISSAYGDSKWNIKARFAEFIPIDSRFQKIYGRCSPSYEVEVSKILDSDIALWGNLGGYTKKGRTLGLHNETRVNLVSFSFGGNYVRHLSHHNQIYFGLGAVISNFWVKNHIQFGRQKVSKGVFGGVIKLGLHHFFTDQIFADFFTDYYYQPVHCERLIDLGGLKVGLGLGYQF